MHWEAIITGKQLYNYLAQGMLDLSDIVKRPLMCLYICFVPRNLGNLALVAGSYFLKCLLRRPVPLAMAQCHAWQK